MGAARRRRDPTADLIPEADRDYYLERLYPSYGNLAPRDIASRAAKRAVDLGHGVGPLKNGVYLDFADAIARLGDRTVNERYSNLFEMYERITGEDPIKVPMRIYPASHYTMGGLWVDYELMTTVPGLYCAGEANFSDHGANRLGASALMQGLADGYFVLPSTISNYLAPLLNKPIPGTDHPAFVAAEGEAPRSIRSLPVDRGTRSPDHFHRGLGHIIGTTAAWSAPLRACRRRSPRSRRSTTSSGRTCASPAPATASTRPRAGRSCGRLLPAGRLMCFDALERDESCGGHFRAEHQDAEGEAQRDDERFARVAAWEWSGDRDDRRARAGGVRATSRPFRQAELLVKAVVVRRGCECDLTGPDAEDLATGRPRRRRSTSRRTAVESISDEASFLELLDRLNERLLAEGVAPIAFDADCREGICGSCGLTVDGQAHGPQRRTATCQLRIRNFHSGAEIVVEPFRATAFPIVTDLVSTARLSIAWSRPEALSPLPREGHPTPTVTLVPMPAAEEAIDAALCIGCGVCVAACPNGAAHLFTGAKLAHLTRLLAGAVGTAPAHRGDGREDGRALRIVHQPRRVRGGVPEGHLDRRHRPDERRLPQIRNSRTASSPPAPTRGHAGARHPIACWFEARGTVRRWRPPTPSAC